MKKIVEKLKPLRDFLKYLFKDPEFLDAEDFKKWK